MNEYQKKILAVMGNPFAPYAPKIEEQEPKIGGQFGEDIIRMARQAHRQLVTEDYPGHTGQLNPWTMRLLERFAALVAAAERKACAKVVENYAGAWDDQGYALSQAIRARGQE
jgi:hypothetical protein